MITQRQELLVQGAIWMVPCSNSVRQRTPQSAFDHLVDCIANALKGMDAQAESRIHASCSQILIKLRTRH